MPKTAEEKRAYYAAYREEHKDEVRDYNRHYYLKSEERREKLAASQKARLAAETPEQREARLAKQRAYNREHYKRIKAGGPPAAPAPDLLPPPPTEEEWSLSEFKAAAALPPPPVGVVPLPPPPAPAPAVTKAVRAVGAGATAEDKQAAKDARKAETKAAKLAAFKEDYIQKHEENLASEKPRWDLGYFQTQGRKKFGLVMKDYKALEEEHKRRYATEIAARNAIQAEKDRLKIAELREAERRTGWAGATWGVAFDLARGYTR